MSLLIGTVVPHGIYGRLHGGKDVGAKVCSLWTETRNSVHRPLVYGWGETCMVCETSADNCPRLKPLIKDRSLIFVTVMTMLAPC